MLTRRLGFAGILLAAGLLGAAPPRVATAAAACEVDEYTGEKVALVVGTDDYSSYQEPEIRKLENAGNDASKMAEVLRGQGFAVRCLIDPTQLVFDDELGRLRRHLLAREQAIGGQAFTGRAVIYVAGHGFRDPQDKDDYLLLQLETNPDLYDGIVDLTTLGGRVDSGRHSMSALVDSFNIAKDHQILFIFDTCRALIKIREQNGVAVRGEQSSPMPRGRMIKDRLIVYSTRPGGVAADSFPAYDDKNGLYTALLSHFIDHAGMSFIRVLHITALLVEAYKPDQLPEHVDRIALFGDRPWITRGVHDDCEALNASIWNSIGECPRVRSEACVLRDICPRLVGHLKPGLSAQMRQCIAQHKERWLKIDLAKICQPSGNPSIVQPSPKMVPAAGALLTADNLNAALLASYAAKPPVETQFPASPMTTPAMRFDPNSLRIAAAPDRLAYANRMRDSLIEKPAPGASPVERPIAPFSINPLDAPLIVRNLPSISADPIGTFNPASAAIEVDCKTIKCADDWLGVRVRKDGELYRGWASVNDLQSIIKPADPVKLKFAPSQITPDAADVATLRTAVRTHAINREPRRDIQLVAIRSPQAGADGSPFIATARLAFVRRILIDSGVNPANVSESIISTMDDAIEALVIVNMTPADPGK